MPPWAPFTRSHVQHDAIGVLNSGSASIKFALFAVDGDQLRPTLKGQIEGIHTKPHFISKSSSGVKDEHFWDEGTRLGHPNATEYLLAYLRNQLAGVPLLGVGHRVVHGGAVFTHPVRVDRNVLSALEKLIPLAPLHQPYNLAPMYLALERIPQLPQVACFDTEFHVTVPEVA